MVTERATRLVLTMPVFDVETAVGLIVPHENPISAYHKGLCAACGGECCKRLPGVCHPDDFGFSPERLEDAFEKLKLLLGSRLFAVDWWEGDPRDGYDWETPGHVSCGYFVRPATVGADKTFDGSWGGTCILLNMHGCALPADRRPYNCRALKPRIPERRKKNGCRIDSETDGVSIKQQLAISWLPYHGVFERLREIY